jgi:hypothetical protein
LNNKWLVFGVTRENGHRQNKHQEEVIKNENSFCKFLKHYGEEPAAAECFKDI